MRHVIASPRFAVRRSQVPAGHPRPRDEVQELAGVDEGDRLLTIDTDRSPRKLATHPWVAARACGGELPSTLSIDVTERRAVAAR